MNMLMTRCAQLPIPRAELSSRFRKYGVLGIALVGPSACEESPISDKRIQAATVRTKVDGLFISAYYHPHMMMRRKMWWHGSGTVIDDNETAIVAYKDIAAGLATEVYVGESKTPTKFLLVGAAECQNLALIRLSQVDKVALAWSNDPPSPGGVYSFANASNVPEFPTVPDKIPATSEVHSFQISGTSAERIDSWSLYANGVLRGTTNGMGPALLVSEQGNNVGLVLDQRGGRSSSGVAWFGAEAKKQLERIEKTGLRHELGVLPATLSEDSVLPPGRSRSGIFASAVRPNSLADHSGLRPKDLITQLGDVDMRKKNPQEVSMARYCDFIAKHDLSREIVRIEIERLTQQGWVRCQGELNGAALTISSPEKSNKPCPKSVVDKIYEVQARTIPVFTPGLSLEIEPNEGGLMMRRLKPGEKLQGQVKFSDNDAQSLSRPNWAHDMYEIVDQQLGTLVVELTTENAELSLELLRDDLSPVARGVKVGPHKIRLEHTTDHHAYRILAITAPPSAVQDIVYYLSYNERPNQSTPGNTQ